MQFVTNYEKCRKYVLLGGCAQIITILYREGHRNVTWGGGSSRFITILQQGGGSVGTPNLYYVIYGRPLVYLVLYSAVFWLVGRTIRVVYRELSKKQNRVFSLVSHWLGGGGEATWNFSPSPSLPVGQNRVMDRYSPPTNYWVNIKYQIRKSRSKLRLYSKSAILRAQQLFSFLCHQNLGNDHSCGNFVSIKQTKLLLIRRIGWG